MHVHVLEVWRHVKNPTPSIDAYTTPDFTPIQFEATEPWAFVKNVPQEEDE